MAVALLLAGVPACLLYAESHQTYVAHGSGDRMEWVLFSPETGHFEFKGQGMPRPAMPWERCAVTIILWDGVSYIENFGPMTCGGRELNVTWENGLAFVEIATPTIADQDAHALIVLMDADRDGMASNGDIVIVWLPAPLDLWTPSIYSHFQLTIDSPDIAHERSGAYIDIREP